jgi:hypothetical protein
VERERKLWLQEEEIHRHHHHHFFFDREDGEELKAEGEEESEGEVASKGIEEEGAQQFKYYLFNILADEMWQVESTLGGVELVNRMPDRRVTESKQRNDRRRVYQIA